MFLALHNPDTLDGCGKLDPILLKGGHIGSNLLIDFIEIYAPAESGVYIFKRVKVQNSLASKWGAVSAVHEYVHDGSKSIIRRNRKVNSYTVPCYRKQSLDEVYYFLLWSVRSILWPLPTFHAINFLTIILLSMASDLCIAALEKTLHLNFI